MNKTAWEIAGMFFAALPFLIVIFLLPHYASRRALWQLRRRRGAKSTGFCPSVAALATAHLILPVFYRPSAMHARGARQHMLVEVDDQGDPDSPHKHLLRQLRKIRQGELVKRLVLRLGTPARTGGGELHS